VVVYDAVEMTMRGVTFASLTGWTVALSGGPRPRGPDPKVVVVDPDPRIPLRARIAEAMRLGPPAADSWDSLRDGLTDLDERLYGSDGAIVVVIVITDRSEVDDAVIAAECLADAAEFWREPGAAGSDRAPRAFHSHVWFARDEWLTEFRERVERRSE
jgi:hypothetical protein